MNVLKKIGRIAAIFLSIGAVAGAVLLGAIAPAANACYDRGNCGGYDYNRCPPWQEWRTDNPGDPWGGCVDLAQHNYVWHCVNGVWLLDPPWMVYGDPWNGYNNYGGYVDVQVGW